MTDIENSFIEKFDRDLFQILINNGYLLTDIGYDNVSPEVKTKLREISIIIMKCFDRP